MSNIIHIPDGATAQNIMSGLGQKHRLCFDFDSIDAVRAFFGKCQADGITHPDSVPILMFEDEGSTIWLVGLPKKVKLAPETGA